MLDAIRALSVWIADEDNIRDYEIKDSDIMQNSIGCEALLKLHIIAPTAGTGAHRMVGVASTPEDASYAVRAD